MIESFATFICANADHAHLMIFLLLLLAGLNIPISEDILLLVGGAIASTCLDGHWIHLYIWIWAGCYISAWEAYWIGRLLGPKVYTIRIFRHIITPERVATLNHYYERFGILTFIVGRFIPGGVRNCLFMTAGLGRMPFTTYLLRDGPASLLSSTVIFQTGFAFGANYPIIVSYFQAYSTVAFGLFALLIGLAILFAARRSSN